jgi:hypothetical protein
MTKRHVHDERDMSGGGPESVMNDAAGALSAVRASPRNLANCVSDASNPSKAERIAGKLR